VSRGHWSDIVNGHHPYPSAKTRQRMLEVLGVPMEDLFSIEAGKRLDATSAREPARGAAGAPAGAAVRGPSVPRQPDLVIRSHFTGGVVPHLVQDLRQALRSVRRDWRFALAYVLPIALGLGAGASFYAIVDQLLFRRPPHVERPDEIVRLAIATDRFPDPFAVGSFGASWVDYDLLARQATALETVAAFGVRRQSLGRGETARTIPVMLATASYFPLLGVRPQLGRFYLPDEDRETASIVPCVASHAFWQSELGGGSDAIGRDLQVGNLRCEVVGVAPAGFNGTGRFPVDLYVPLRASGEAFNGGDATLWSSASSHWLYLIGRPRPGMTKAQVDFDATRAYQSFPTRVRDPDMKFSMLSGPLFDTAGILATTRVRTALWLVGGAAALLLLVAANLVNLLVARNLGRMRETAIRLALGGSRGRLFTRHLVECVLLSTSGGAAALLVVAWVGPVVRGVLYPGSNWVDDAMSLRVVATAIVASQLLGGIIAALTALHASRIDPAALLAAGGGSRTTASRASHRARLALVATQAALSLALLVASAGFVRSFRNAADTALGFDIDGLVFAEVGLTGVVQTRDEERAFYLEARDRMARIPGVASVSLGYNTPWHNNRSEEVRIPGRDSLPPVPAFRVPVFDAVSPEYLETMRLRLRAGRWLAEADGPGAAPVMVVTASLARLYWGDERGALGQCVIVGESPACREVVGVVDDIRFTGGLGDPHVPLYYLPLAQAAGYRAPPKLFIRVRGDVQALLPALRRTLQGVRDGLPAADVHPLRDHLDPLLASWRLGAMAFTALGALAAGIAMLGLFSVIAYLVAERRKEFAIRSALGATRRQIAGPVIRQALGVVGAGALVGLYIVSQASPWLEPQLFGVTLLDARTVGAVAGGLLGVAVLAVLGPARRAALLDPIEALRSE
jgi:predicted permease